MPASSLRLFQVQAQIRDDSIRHRLVGLRGQLEPLALYLNEHSDLGQPQPIGFLPGATGPEAVLARVVSPLAMHYLTELPDVAAGDSQQLDALDADLERLCQVTVATTTQIALGGLALREAFGPYRDVVLRPLTAAERGAVTQEQMVGMAPTPSTGDFVIPRSPKPHHV